MTERRRRHFLGKGCVRWSLKGECKLVGGVVWKDIYGLWNVWTSNLLYLPSVLLWCLGPPGPPGLQGPTGIPGDTESCLSPPKSAFAVKLTDPLPAPSQPIVFKEALHNDQDHFNLTTGAFTCTIPGVYRFGFDIELFQHAVKLGLVKNGTQILEKESKAKDDYRHLSGNVVLQLTLGDRVWLESKLDTMETEKGPIQSMFFGYLLYGHYPG